MVLEAHKDFAKFELPIEAKDAFKQFPQLFGVSLNKFKLLTFIKDNNIENVREYLGLNSKRMEGESFADYKSRLRFSNLILKFRKFI